MMKEFIPAHIPCNRITGYNHWQQANDYLFHILNEGPEWIINIDEDVFVTDWQLLESLVKYMRDNELEYAGMCDGGVCPHRTRSWVVANPFFNVFNAGSIRRKIQRAGKDYITKCTYQAWMNTKKPAFLTGPVNHDSTEPFTGLFYWLMNVSKGLYLNAATHQDRFSTLLQNHEGKVFLYHSWMAREFHSVAAQRKRILNLYEEAKALRSCNE